MNIVKKTSPTTGKEFNCIELENGSLVCNNEFRNRTFVLNFDQRLQCYYLPKDAIEHVPTMTLTEASEYLGISPMSVSRLCSQGELNAVKLNGVLMIESSSVENRGKEKHDRQSRELDNQHSN